MALTIAKQWHDVWGTQQVACYKITRDNSNTDADLGLSIAIKFCVDGGGEAAGTAYPGSTAGHITLVSGSGTTYSYIIVGY